MAKSCKNFRHTPRINLKRQLSRRAIPSPSQLPTRFALITVGRNSAAPSAVCRAVDNSNKLNQSMASDRTEHPCGGRRYAFPPYDNARARRAGGGNRDALWVMGMKHCTALIFRRSSASSAANRSFCGIGFAVRKFQYSARKMCEYFGHVDGSCIRATNATGKYMPQRRVISQKR